MADRLPYPVHDLTASILGAIVSEPGEWTPAKLSKDLDAPRDEISEAIAWLRGGGYLAGPSPYRPSEAGRAAVLERTAPTAVTPALHEVLVALAGGLHGRAQIAAALEVSAPAASVRLNALQARGLVVNVGRGEWALSEAGEAVLPSTSTQPDPGDRPPIDPEAVRSDPPGDAPAGDVRPVAPDPALVVELPRRGLSVVPDARTVDAHDDGLELVRDRLHELQRLTRELAFADLAAEIDHLIAERRADLHERAR